MGLFRESLTDETVKEKLKEIFAESEGLASYIDSLNPENFSPVEEPEKKKQLLEYAKEVLEKAEAIESTARGLKKMIKPY